MHIISLSSQHSPARRSSVATNTELTRWGWCGVYVHMFSQSRSRDIGRPLHSGRSACTPSSHHSIFPHNTFCPRVGLPRNFILIGSLTAALRFSKGWVRKDLNLVMGIGCTLPVKHVRAPPRSAGTAGTCAPGSSGARLRGSSV